MADGIRPWRGESERPLPPLPAYLATDAARSAEGWILAWTVYARSLATPERGKDAGPA